jgi:hypothetical protein
MGHRLSGHGGGVAAERLFGVTKFSVPLVQGSLKAEVILKPAVDR